jgi:hypothetical protein
MLGVLFRIPDKLTWRRDKTGRLVRHYRIGEMRRCRHFEGKCGLSRALLCFATKFWNRFILERPYGFGTSRTCSVIWLHWSSKIKNGLSRQHFRRGTLAGRHYNSECSESSEQETQNTAIPEILWTKWNRPKSQPEKIHLLRWLYALW